MDDYGFDLDRFSITAWYFHEQRTIGLLGGYRVIQDLAPFLASAPNSRVRVVSAAATGAIVDWVRRKRPLSLRGSVPEDRLRSGEIFVLFDNFYCKDIGTLAAPGAQDRHGIIHKKLTGAGDRRLSMRIFPEHLTTNSAFFQLQGQAQLLVIGLIDSVTAEEVAAFPYVIGTLVNSPLPSVVPATPIGESPVGAERLRSLADDEEVLGGPQRAAPATRTPSRVEIRKRETRRLHARWQTSYREFKKRHPTKSDSWIAQEIAKKPEAQGRNPETIRKNMKPK